jgi:hypothetical protein
MSRQHIEFPVVIGVATTTPAANEQVLAALVSTFSKIRDRSSGALVVAIDDSSAAQITQAAKQAGLPFHLVDGFDRVKATGEEIKALGTADMELAEASDILLVVVPEKSSGHDSDQDDLLAYARAIGRPVVLIDADTGAVTGDVPEHIEVDRGWLPELFEIAGLHPDADLVTIKSRMSAVANKTAPITRARWNWIVFFQGLAVCVPLGWLVGLPVRWIGLVAFVTTLSFFALHWLLRLKNMQKTWAQARLVAEVARSLLATSSYPAAAPWQSLSLVPALRPLRWVKVPSAPKQPFKKWLSNYVSDRLQGQEKYFTQKMNEATAQRKRLTRWTTVSLNLGLGFAAAGLLIAFTPAGSEWIAGGSLSQMTLGIATLVILLVPLLIQILRDLQELNRRTARFAQQREVVQQANSRLSLRQEPSRALEIVADTESKLLAEVLEWYFHAETAERFVELQEPVRRSLPARFLKEVSPTRRLIQTIPRKALRAGFLLLQVILAQLPLVIISAVVVVAWIFLRLPEQGGDFKRLEQSVSLRDADDKTLLSPALEQEKHSRGEHGYVVLAHGLYGRGILTGEKEEDARNWMQPCADEIKKGMGNRGEPTFCLVDWSEAAMPSNFYNRIFGTRNLLTDIPAIRGQAYRVGDIAAFRLAGIILQNHLPIDVPFHLIGHSAGGFVVTRMAMRLTELGVVPRDKAKLHVTILDTPAPNDELLFDLPQTWPTDFYVTSPIGGKVPITSLMEMIRKGGPLKLADLHAPSLHMVELHAPADKQMWDKHKWSYTWFMESMTKVDCEKCNNEGFKRSSLVAQTQPVSAP